MKKTKKTGLLFAVILGALLVFHNNAYAINVEMKRIVFEGTKNSDTITITNDTKKTQTYALEWQHYIMSEGRKLQNIPLDQKVEGVRWADEMIHFTQPHIIVPPGKTGKVHLVLDLPTDIQPGEYRTHLSIRTETPPHKSPKRQNIMQLTIQPAITLPVFIRYGEQTAHAEITHLSILPEEKDARAKIQLTLNRTGNRSLYGDFEFVCMSEKKQKKLLKTIHGMAVYAEVNQRKFSFRIRTPADLKKSCQQIQANYKSQHDDALFKGKILATASADIPQ